MIRSAGNSDSAALAELYNYYVRNTWTTFEEEPVSAGEMGALLYREFECWIDVGYWQLVFGGMADPDLKRGNDS